MPNPCDIQIEVFGKTDVGLVREHNEDNFLVADVTAATRSSEAREPLKMSLGDKGALLLVCDGMGTTCTVAGLVDGTLVVGQIGDSRCYVLRDGKLAQVTKDQSLAWQLIEAGAMTPEEAKAFEHANIILQALGVQERVEVVLSQVELRKGDVVLLCSDGLHGPVSDEEILAVLIAEADLKKAAGALVQKALDRDGPDNITVGLARFDGESLKAPALEDVVTFVPYDPGSDPVPEPIGGSGPNKETLEEPIPRELMTTEDIVTKADGTPLPAAAASSAPTPRTPRSMMAFFFLALLAAAAGGIFVMKCERDQAARGDSRSAAP